MNLFKYLLLILISLSLGFSELGYASKRSSRKARNRAARKAEARKQAKVLNPESLSESLENSLSSQKKKQDLTQPPCEIQLSPKTGVASFRCAFCRETIFNTEPDTTSCSACAACTHRECLSSNRGHCPSCNQQINEASDEDKTLDFEKLKSQILVTSFEAGNIDDLFDENNYASLSVDERINFIVDTLVEHQVFHSLACFLARSKILKAHPRWHDFVLRGILRNDTPVSKEIGKDFFEKFRTELLSQRPIYSFSPSKNPSVRWDILFATLVKQKKEHFFRGTQYYFYQFASPYFVKVIFIWKMTEKASIKEDPWFEHLFLSMRNKIAEYINKNWESFSEEEKKLWAATMVEVAPALDLNWLVEAKILSDKQLSATPEYDQIKATYQATLNSTEEENYEQILDSLYSESEIGSQAKKAEQLKASEVSIGAEVQQDSQQDSQQKVKENQNLQQSLAGRIWVRVRRVFSGD